ncbi:MAG: FAD-binding protein [Betaproteobacteria bacterium]|nr:FAD-binding protein [Betaproteobacteria bacterium]
MAAIVETAEEPAAIVPFLDPGFVARLRAALPASCLLTDPEDTVTYESDGLFHLHEKPLAVALPEDEAQVAAVLRACRDFQVPIVPRGAGTGLAGGALPHRHGILMSLTKMKALTEVDVAARQARVQPGHTNLAISQKVAAHGLFYAPDPSSQLASSIGGNVAENSGGVHCLKYGLTVHNVIGLRVVTSDGDVLELGRGSLDQPGYDVVAILNGSEGLLGIVTEVRVRLLPTPPAIRVLLAFFPTTQDAGNAVGAIIGAGIIPAGLEMMDTKSMEASESFMPLGLRLDAGAGLLCELDGLPEEVEELTARVSALMEQCNGFDIREADDEAQRARLWWARKGAYPALVKIANDVYICDSTVPRRSLGRVMAKIDVLSAQHRIPVAQMFHAGDGNIHPVLYYDSTQPGESERAEELATDILKLVIAEGGTVSGEHGVGSEKLKGMCMQFDETELEAFQAVRRAFDPHGVLNPDKAIPTLHRCAEFGSMRIRFGQDPFAHLPRF